MVETQVFMGQIFATTKAFSITFSLNRLSTIRRRLWPPIAGPSVLSDSFEESLFAQSVKLAFHSSGGNFNADPPPEIANICVLVDFNISVR